MLEKGSVGSKLFLLAAHWSPNAFYPLLQTLLSHPETTKLTNLHMYRINSIKFEGPLSYTAKTPQFHTLLSSTLKTPQFNTPLSSTLETSQFLV